MSNEQAEALELARPIVEADLHAAIDHCDADWEGMSRTALEAIDRALSTPSPAPSDTLERREAIAEVERMRGAAFHWRRPALRQVEGPNDLKIYGGTIADDIDRWADMLERLALSLPAREVSGERAREVLAHVVEGEPFSAGSSVWTAKHIRDGATMLTVTADTAILAMLRFANEALATTPAPREMEADLVEAKAALERILDVRVSRDDNIWAGAERCRSIARATLNRLSEEG